MDVLILCTANQCRSPMAEVLLRDHLHRAGIHAAVSSAGLYPGGQPATDHGVATMATRGLDLRAHRSRQLERALVDQADLIVGMTRQHVREVAVLDAEAIARAFTLKELVRAGEAIGPRQAGEPVSTWLARVASGRRRESLLGVAHDPDLDVADPIGRGRDEYERTADELDGLLARLVELLWPAAEQQQKGTA